MTKYAKFALVNLVPECDFCCTSTQIHHSYQAADFIIDKSQEFVQESKGAWAACKDCYELIEAGKWEELLDRSVDSFKVKYGVKPPGLKMAIGNIHKLFRQHMRRSA